jgi:hypothetical protein
MNSQLLFYNPREATREVLEAMLVGREDIRADILSDLTRQRNSKSRQHWLIRGPRGIGKTHFTGIIYHHVRKDPVLSKAYLAIWMSETDAYEAYSSGTLLSLITEQLIEELRSLQDPRSGDFENEFKEIREDGDGQALFEDLRNLLVLFAKRLGRIFLVLIENLDALLAGFAPKKGNEEAKRLRSLLQNDREFLFVSTTPTNYLKELSNPSFPLYGLLKERKLQPLTEEQVGELFIKLGEITGHPEKGALLGPKGDGPSRRRVLYHLMSGNPRSIVMAFTMLAESDGVSAMVGDLAALLDKQTAYFEARLSRLASRESAIVTVMCRSSTTLTAQEIAKLTRLPERSISTQLSRLIEEGYLEYADGAGGKGSLYQFADGLFRLWYRYRKGKKLLEPIVEFLWMWYEPEELEKALLALEAKSTSQSLPLLEQEWLKKTLFHIKEALQIAKSDEGKETRAFVWAVHSDEMQEAMQKAADEIVSAFKSGGIGGITQKLLSMPIDPQNDPPQRMPTLVLILYNLGFALLGRGEKQEAEAHFSNWAELLTNTTWPASLEQDFNALFLGLLSRFPLDKTRLWLDKIATSKVNPKAAETAIFNLFVLDALEAAELVQTGQSSNGPAARVRRALARVPPELRQTVKDVANQIQKNRRAQLKTKKQPSTVAP